MRVKTGIEGLDKALKGGIPKGNIVLVSGGAGTGKSTLCMQYLYNGAKLFGEKGLYVSTEQGIKELKKAAETYGWNLEELEKKGLVKLVYFDAVESDNFLEKIYDLYASFTPKRIAIDSLTTLADSLMISGDQSNSAFSLAKVAESVSPIPKSERIIQKSLLYHLMKKLRLFDATILMTSELLEGESGLSADQISEFICDGVIVLKSLTVGEILNRTIEIRKMRYSPMDGGIKSYEIGPQGLLVA
ncbi:MAG: ATPase domain-containing protein [Candidatus Diapherotrites archaeon]